MEGWEVNGREEWGNPKILAVFKPFHLLFPKRTGKPLQWQDQHPDKVGLSLIANYRHHAT